jgi:hypothetical protein
MIRLLNGRGSEKVSKVRFCNEICVSFRFLIVFIDGGLLAWITIGVNTTNYGLEQPPGGKRDWHLDGIDRRDGLGGNLTVLAS